MIETGKGIEGTEETGIGNEIEEGSVPSPGKGMRDTVPKERRDLEARRMSRDCQDEGRHLFGGTGPQPDLNTLRPCNIKQCRVSDY